MGGVSRTFNSQYDAAGNRIVRSSPSDNYAAFAYDALGRMSAYKEGATTVVGFDYDPAGHRSGLRFAAGATSTVSYGYDSVGRLASLTRDLAGTGADQALGFTHNPASQIVTRSSSNDAYASNAALNVSRTYGVNGLNQYTQDSTGCDPNGNLVSDGMTSCVRPRRRRLEPRPPGAGPTIMGSAADDRSVRPRFLIRRSNRSSLERSGNDARPLRRLRLRRERRPLRGR